MKAVGASPRGYLYLNITSCRFSCFIVRQKTNKRLHIHTLISFRCLNFNVF